MNILNNKIKRKIQNNIIDVALRKEFDSVLENISDILDELYANILDYQRFSYGPHYPLSILKNMFKESAPYPRTSVGNNLSDLARQLPDLVYDLLKELVDTGDKNSYWIAYRACRNLVKKESIKIMNLLKVDEYKYKERIYKRSEYQGN